MKILHVIEQLSEGGASRAMLFMISRTRSAGDHVILSLISPSCGGASLAKALGIQVLKTDEKALFLGNQFDVALVHWWNSPKIRIFLESVSELPVVLWIHVVGNQAPHVVTKDWLNRCDAVYCSCQKTYSLVKNLVQEMGVRKAAIDWGVAHADFSRLQSVLKKSSDRFRIGYIGTVNPVKLHADFVSLCASLDIASVEFIVAGFGDFSYLKRQLVDTDLEKKVRFIGYTDKIGEVFGEIDVLGYPLCADTYAAAEYVIQEAMYAGVPVVAFPYGGITGIISHQQNGLIVNSPAEYKAALEFLHNHRFELARLGEQARAFALSTFDHDREAHKIFDVCLKAQRKGKADCSRQPSGPEPVQSGAEIFVESLGESRLAYAFRKSRIEAGGEGVFSCDYAISNVTPVMLYGGLLSYASQYPDDAFLRYWTGLVLLKQGRFVPAEQEFRQAAVHGFPHERLGIYLYIVSFMRWGEARVEMPSKGLMSKFLNSSWKCSDSVKLFEDRWEEACFQFDSKKVV